MKFYIRNIILVSLLSLVHLTGTSAQCEFINDITGLSVTGQTAGDNTQEYVLVSAETGNILSINSSAPDFFNLTGGDYEVYGINYEGTRPIEIAVGSPWVGAGSISTCFDATLPYMANVCEDICENESLIISSTGFNMTGGFQQVYILIDTSTGLIVAQNTTGNFPSSTYAANDNLIIYALNTEDAGIIAAVTAGATWSTVESTINAGCADLLGPRGITVVSTTDPSCCTTQKVFIR